MYKNRISILVLLLLLLVSPVTQAKAFPNEPHGFNGMAWGTDFQEVKGNFYLHRKTADTLFYIKKHENYVSSDLNISYIEYGFKKGKFACATILCSGDIDSFIHAMDYLYHTYGPGVIITRDKSGKSGAYAIDCIKWSGDRATIVLDKYKLGQPGSIRISSNVHGR